MKLNAGRRAHRRYAAAAGLVMLGGAGVTSSAYGQTAYFSVQGSFAAIGDKHDFNINLSRSVSNAETLKFQTFARNGGTNAAGDVIPANGSGIDSVLTLIDSLNASRGADDDQPGAVLDSLLTWTGSDVNLNPSPLPSGKSREEHPAHRPFEHDETRAVEQLSAFAHVTAARRAHIMPPR